MGNDEEYEHLPTEFYYPEERRRNYRKCHIINYLLT